MRNHIDNDRGRGDLWTLTHKSTSTTTGNINDIIELDSPCQATLRRAEYIGRHGVDDLEALRHAIAESDAAHHIVTDPQRRPVSRCSVSHRQASIDNETAAGGALVDPTATDGRQGSMATLVTIFRP